MTSPDIMRLAVMMQVRFPISRRNIEDILHQRGIEISPETVRFWLSLFRPLYAAEFRTRRVSGIRSNRWHLDEVFVWINGQQNYPCRVVDHQGEVLDVL